MDKKYLVTIITSLIVIPTLIFGRDRICQVWAAPEKVAVVEKKVSDQEKVESQLSKLVLEQEARMDKAEEINKLQVDNLKELISVTKDLKKK